MTGPGELITLRDYQQETIDAINIGWTEGVRRPVAVLPTGAGKTVVFAHLVKEFLRENPHKRVLILAHTDELVTQAAQKVKVVAPHLPVGIVKGARNDVTPAVIVASVQSLRREERRNQIRDVGLVIIDECHHAVAKTYMDVLTHFGAFDDTSVTRFVGFTATLARSDRESLGKVWEKVVISRSILFMIQKGYLLNVRGVSVEVPDLDLSAVKRSRGDFQESDLGRAMTESLAPECVADAYLEHAKDRAGLAFWPTVDAAYVGAEAMNARGIVTEVVHGALKTDDRRGILARFMKGDTQVISNCMVLTEGFDAPIASAAVIGRPTRFKGLYIQIAGRVLRPYPGQQEALLLDVCGASEFNDLCTMIDLADKPLTIRDGETLMDAVQREEEAAGEVAPYHGPVVFAEFDPFKRKSGRVWMETRGGTHFLAWGTDRYLFLVPSTEVDARPGTWDVAWCVKVPTQPHRMPDGTYRRGGFTEHRAMDLGFAMQWADDMVNQFGGENDFGRKNSAWRKRPANEKQLNYARRLGCRITDGMSGNEVSEAIDVAIASPQIDFYVANILKMGGK